MRFNKTHLINVWYGGVILAIMIWLFLWAIGANAQVVGRDVTMTWTKPERNCDGTLLTNLAGFRAYWGQGTSQLADPAKSAFTITNLTPGPWWVAVTAYNATGQESPLAGPVMVTIANDTLKTTATTVYTVIKGTNLFITLPVGTVPLGTPCDPTQRVNRYYVVDRGLVTWSGSVKPTVVVGTCD